MSKFNFDADTSLGYMLEGTLRKTKKGVWLIEKYDGTLERLDDALDTYKNKEVRLSVVDLKEADYLHHQLAQGQDDDDGDSGNDGDESS